MIISELATAPAPRYSRRSCAQFLWPCCVLSDWLSPGSSAHPLAPPSLRPPWAKSSAKVLGKAARVRRPGSRRSAHCQRRNGQNCWAGVNRVRAEVEPFRPASMRPIPIRRSRSTPVYADRRARLKPLPQKPRLPVRRHIATTGRRAGSGGSSERRPAPSPRYRPHSLAAVWVRRWTGRAYSHD